MGFMRHITACNQHEHAAFIPFLIDCQVFGDIRPRFSAELGRWPDVFKVTPASVELVLPSTDLAERNIAVNTILQHLATEKIIGPFHGEMYAVADEVHGAPCLLLDRAIAPYFGIRSYGQHLNGYVRANDGLKLWIARRAQDRGTYPGYLDNFVAGGLPHGLNLAENLTKECWEEASVPADIADRVIPVGAVSYNLDTVKGFCPFTLFCYDLELPADFVPQCTDGEVEQFYLWPVEKVMAIVRDTAEFKPNCNLVIIDFLIRQGYIGPDDDDYLALLNGLHPARGRA